MNFDNLNKQTKILILREGKRHDSAFFFVTLFQTRSQRTEFSENHRVASI